MSVGTFFTTYRIEENWVFWFIDNSKGFFILETDTLYCLSSLLLMLLYYYIKDKTKENTFCTHTQKISLNYDLNHVLLALI